ncbi:hypothetical protein [Paludisphaera soli]|uniref:hypothetical protein n=1 Tax=Paludisphaera soli TaxID=2712865 RepID=UPI0013EA0670|nr:hypothetical protein [Paludisphaera soli]
MPPTGQAATTAVIYVLSVGAAGCCCLLSLSAPRLLVPGGCGFILQCDSSALYHQAPMALCLVLGLAVFARLGHPQAASLTRCAALVSTSFWIFAVGLAREWW